MASSGTPSTATTACASISAAAISNRNITYNGGGQTAISPTVGDQLFLDGGGTFTDVTYNYTNENDGSIDITGNGSGGGNFLTYTGLEPVTSTVTATNVTLNFSGAAETINVTQSGASTRVDSTTAGEVTTFTNPSGLLTINAGDGADIINVQGFGTGFGAGLTIAGQGAQDSIVYTATAALNSGRNANFTAERITFLNSSLTTTNGNITATASGGSGGNFVGLNVDNSDLTANGSGTIALSGQGGDSGVLNAGVQIDNTSTVSTTDGTLTITGTGGVGTSLNYGVSVETAGTTVTSVNGAISITGTGGDGSTSANLGVNIASGADISSTGTGVNAATITIHGSGGDGTSINSGVVVAKLGNDRDQRRRCDCDQGHRRWFDSSCWHTPRGRGLDLLDR